MKKSSILIVGVLLLLLIPITSAGVTDLAPHTGPTYINWSWQYSGGTTETAIHIDGLFVTNTPLTSYTLSNLQPREEHIITLTNIANPTDIYATNTVKTFYSPIFFYFLLILSFLLFGIMLFFHGIIVRIIIGTLGFIVSTTNFYLSFPFHFSIFSYLCIGLSALFIIWIIGILFVLISSNKEEEL